LQAQIMDTLEIEQQRGITVKAMHASLVYTPPCDDVATSDSLADQEDLGGDEELRELARELQELEAAELAAKGEHALTHGSYLLNLIDTPGHVDFSHEVMRTLAACQSAVLLVDAVQGVQAQTVAVHAAARAADLLIIPVINKIDLPTADVPRVLLQLESAFGVDIGPGKLQPNEARVGDVVCVSAKTGLNVQELMQVIVARTPHPTGDQTGPMRAALVDSWFDTFRGVICLVQVVDGGPLTVGTKLRSLATGLTHAVTEVGLLHPQVGLQPAPGGLHCGQVGYIIANIRDPRQAVAGDTLCFAQDAAKVSPLERAVEPRHMVFAGVYPTDGADYEILADAIEKLRLSDTSLTVEKESSVALGLGFRVGFLGALHMEVFHERLAQEHGADVIVTAPTVPYRLIPSSQALQSGDHKVQVISNAAEFSDAAYPTGWCIEEPMIEATVITPDHYLGNVLELFEEHRGTQEKMELWDERGSVGKGDGGSDMVVVYKLPLAEVIGTQFHDKIKATTSGYASFDYKERDYEKAAIQKMNVHLNGESVDALSVMVHQSQQQYIGRRLVDKLAETMPRQLFDIAIQAKSNGKIVARSTVKALRKNVTAKCYGGDMSRKKKLLNKQKEGKKRMRAVSANTAGLPAYASKPFLHIRSGATAASASTHCPCCATNCLLLLCAGLQFGNVQLSKETFLAVLDR
jgi:elongation factor 4